MVQRKGCGETRGQLPASRQMRGVVSGPKRSCYGTRGNPRRLTLASRWACKPDRSAGSIAGAWLDSGGLRVTVGGFNEARAVLAGLERQGRTFVLEHEAKKILQAYGIPVIQDHFCASEEESLKAARAVGYPVVVKVVSPQISHKSDVGGVRVGVSSEDELRHCYQEMRVGIGERLDAASILGVLIEPVAKGREIFIGTSRDPQFGPLMMFGLGGVFVEILKDISYGLAPLTASEARRMIRDIKGYPILQGARGGRSVDEGVLIDVLVKVSRFLADFPQVEEMDINPLFAEGEKAVVTDARLHLGQAPAHESENDQRLDLEKLF